VSTRERLGTNVNTDMTLQITVHLKRLSTLRTLIRYIVAVCITFVPLQCAYIDKAFAAKWAVAPFASSRCWARLQASGTTGSQSLARNVAGVRFCFTVDSVRPSLFRLRLTGCAERSAQIVRLHLGGFFPWMTLAVSF